MTQPNERDMETARGMVVRHSGWQTDGLVEAVFMEAIAAALARRTEECAGIVAQMQQAEDRAYQATHRQYHADRACAFHEAEAAIRAGSAPAPEETKP